MGAGSYTAGAAGAGAEEATVSTGVAAPTLPAAYDPRSRAIPIDAAGTIKGAHWVDQSMALCLTNELGGIPAAPLVGVDRKRLRATTRENAQSVVESVVNDGITHLLKLGAVDLILVLAVWRSGRLGYLVRYRNLFLPSSDVATLEA